MNTPTTTVTETEDKIVYRRTWEHSVYNGYTITKTEIDVNNFFQGKVSSGSIRYEWTATNGTDIAEARTLKLLKQRIDLL